MFGDPTRWSDAAISVLVCDDSAVGRRQLTVALEAGERIEVVAEADGGEAALAEVVDSAPDVVWMGLGLPGLAGVRLIASIADLVPATRFVVMGGPGDDEARARALRVGAHAGVRREEAPALAVAVTERVAWGRPWLEARDVAAVLAAHDALARQVGSLQQHLEPPVIDERSRRVLAGLASGTERAQVAADHDLSLAATDGVVAEALALLHRHARAEALVFTLDAQDQTAG